MTCKVISNVKCVFGEFSSTNNPSGMCTAWQGCAKVSAESHGVEVKRAQSHSSGLKQLVYA